VERKEFLRSDKSHDGIALALGARAAILNCAGLFCNLVGYGFIHEGNSGLACGEVSAVDGHPTEGFEIHLGVTALV
jgi:hypothetical protein